MLRASLRHLCVLCHAACILPPPVCAAENTPLSDLPKAANDILPLRAGLRAACLKCSSAVRILWHHQSAVICTELDLPDITSGSHTTRHRCEPARRKKEGPSHSHVPTNARSLRRIRTTSILTAPPTKCIPLSLPANYSVSHYVGQNISVVVVVVYILHICSATSCICVSFFHSLTVAHVQLIFQLIRKHSLNILCLTGNGLYSHLNANEGPGARELSRVPIRHPG